MITFLRFARAHTIVGTTVSVLVLYLMAGRHLGAQDWTLFGISLLACLFANVYITGLNQLTDVEIDRINKPYLPLASGAYSMATGRVIVWSCLVGAVLTCLLYRPWLTATVISSLLIGTAYSVEPVRLKRYHFWAAFCIIAVRGLIVNLLLYLHFRTELGGSLHVHDNVLALTFVILLFGAVIAWFKDLPDTEGDAAFGIRTLSLVRDRGWVFRLGSGALVLAFLVAGTMAAARGEWVVTLGLGSLLLAYILLGRQLDLGAQRSIARFYQGVWVLFFAVYGVYGVFG